MTVTIVWVILTGGASLFHAIETFNATRDYRYWSKHNGAISLGTLFLALLAACLLISQLFFLATGLGALYFPQPDPLPDDGIRTYLLQRLLIVGQFFIFMGGILVFLFRRYVGQESKADNRVEDIKTELRDDLAEEIEKNRKIAIEILKELAYLRECREREEQ